MILRLILSGLLLAVLIFVVNRAVDLKDLPNLILSFPKKTLIELLSISVVISVLKAWRFLILLRNSKIPVSFWTTFKTFVAGQAITPLPGGEAIRGVLLRHETGTNILKTTGPVITQAYLELASAAILTLIGALVFQLFRIPALIIMIILILTAIFLTNKKIVDTLCQKFCRVKFINSFLARIQASQEDIKANFYDHKSGLPDKVLVRTLILSFIAHLLGGLLVFLTTQAYGVDLGYLRAVFVYTSGLVIQGIGTVVPGGLGLTEGGMTGILLLSDIEISKALAIVLIFRVITLFFNILVGLIFLGIFYSKSLLLKRKVALER